MKIYKAIRSIRDSWFYVFAESLEEAWEIIFELLGPEYIGSPGCYKKGHAKKYIKTDWTLTVLPGITSSTKIQGTKAELTDRTFYYKYKPGKP